MKKKIILTIATVLLLTVAVGTTVAYLVTSTNPVVNTFNPSHVTTAVVENSGTPVTADNVDTGTSKDNVQIKNTGDTEAYIRAAVVVTWKNSNGNVYGKTPLSTDYTISFNSDAWIQGSDGYWYHKAPVAADTLTSVLIISATQNVAGPVGSDGTTYNLSIEIVASGIQSTPASVFNTQWASSGLEVGTDRNLTTVTTGG